MKLFLAAFGEIYRNYVTLLTSWDRSDGKLTSHCRPGCEDDNGCRGRRPACGTTRLAGKTARFGDQRGEMRFRQRPADVKSLCHITAQVDEQFP